MIWLWLFVLLIAIFSFYLYLSQKIVQIRAKKFNDSLLQFSKANHFTYITPLIESARLFTKVKHILKVSSHGDLFYHGFIEGLIGINHFTLKAEHVSNNGSGHFVSCLEVFVENVPDIELYIPNVFSRISHLWGSQSDKIGTLEFQKQFKCKTSNIIEAETFFTIEKQKAFLNFKRELSQLKRSKFLFRFNDLGFFILFSHLLRQHELEELFKILRNFLKQYHHS